MNKEEETIQIDQVGWKKKQIELLEIKNIIIETQ